MRTAVGIVSMFCGLAAIVLCGFTVMERKKLHQQIAIYESRFQAEPPVKFAWKQKVVVVDGFYRGREGEVLKTRSDSDGRHYHVRVRDEDGYYQMISVRESELGQPVGKSDLEQIQPYSGALYYRSGRGELYRGDVDTVKPLAPPTIVAPPVGGYQPTESRQP